MSNREQLERDALGCALDEYLSNWEGDPVEVLNALAANNHEDAERLVINIWEPHELQPLPWIAEHVTTLMQCIVAIAEEHRRRK